MKLETKTQNINTAYLLSLPSAQIVLSTNLVANGEDVKIEKVLTATCDVRILSTEAFTDEVALSGKVNYKLIYLDTEGTLRSLDYIADFADNIATVGASPTMKIFASCQMLESEVSVKDNTAEVSCIVDIKMQAVDNGEISAVIDVENAYSCKENKTFSSLISVADGAFEVEKDFDINAEVGKILLFDTKCVVKDAKVNDGAIMMMGEVIASVTYDTDRGVDTRCFAIDFNEEIAASGAEVGMNCIPCSYVKSSKLVISSEAGVTTFGIEAIVGTNTPIMADKEYEIVTDVFTPECEIYCDKKTVANSRIVTRDYFDEKISGIATLDEEMPSVSMILTTCAVKNITTNMIAENNCIIIEGLLTANVLYKDYDEKINCVAVELPYSIKENISGVTPDMSVIGKIIDNCVVARIRRDKEIEINSELLISCCIVQNCEIGYIAGLTEGEMKQNDAMAISIYLASKGERIWDIAKALSASPDRIRALNPNLKEVLDGNERVTIYRHRDMDNTLR